MKLGLHHDFSSYITYITTQFYNAEGIPAAEEF